MQRKLSKFNSDFSDKPQPIRKLDPSTGDMREYRYPLEYDLKLIFDFAAGTIGLEEDIEVALENVIRIIWWNPFSYEKDKDDDYYQVYWRYWKEYDKLGFLCYYVKTKLKLYQGKDLQALELAVLSNYTNQHICSLVSSGEIDGSKPSTSWVIPNEEARFYLMQVQPNIYNL